MKKSLIVGACALTIVMSVAGAAEAKPAPSVQGPLVSRVTDNLHGNYLAPNGRHDGVNRACSTTRRAQVEPTIAVDPHNPQRVTAGAIDFCINATQAGYSWVGIYRSDDGGATWQAGLIPGYPGDRSRQGRRSLAHTCTTGTGDPTAAYGPDGSLYYVYECTDGRIIMTTYRPDGRYARTAIVTASTDEAFDDKPNLVVDQTSGRHSGTVYVSWTRNVGGEEGGGEEGGETKTVVARSTDRGRSFGDGVVVDESEWDAGLDADTFSDLAVGPDGSVYVTYRAQDQIRIGVSQNGGRTFDARRVAPYVRYDSEQFSPVGLCGFGLFQFCEDGVHTPKVHSLSAVAADARGVHVIWSGKLPSGEAKIFVRNSRDGLRWSSHVRTIDRVRKGHQIFPDLTTGGGRLTAVFYDSRRDPGYDPKRPTGNRADGHWSHGGYDVIVATSSNGGRRWTEQRVTDKQINPVYPAVDPGLRIPFFGDYIYVSAAGRNVNAIWIDTRDLVTGTDPRKPQQEGFEVKASCDWQPNDIDAPSFTSPLNANLEDLLEPHTDACYDEGGQDLNVYAVRLEG
jgi:hypothetical protein